MAMKEDIKEKWVAALRSGKYKQGKHRLKNGRKYCCLGVLCDISGLDEFKNRGDRGEVYLNDIMILPQEVVNWAGLETSNPVIVQKDGIIALAELNDKGANFNTIADLIEAQL